MAFVKWLRCLKYMTIISIIISVFTCFEFIRNSNFFTWIYHYGEKFILYGAWVVCGITIYCLYRLSSLNNRYKKASFFYLLYFACDLACILLLRIDFSEPMWDIMRVIPCCAVTGQAAGTAAAMTDDFSSLDVTKLQKILEQDGVALHEKEII